MLAPRLSGVPQGALELARLETYISVPPDPPALSEAKNRLRLSGAINGQPSSAVVLMFAPRFSGADHAEYRCGSRADEYKSISPEPPARFELK